MLVTWQTAGLQTLAQVRAVVEGNAPVLFTLTDRHAAHRWMAETLKRGFAMGSVPGRIKAYCAAT